MSVENLPPSSPNKGNTFATKENLSKNPLGNVSSKKLPIEITENSSVLNCSRDSFQPPSKKENLKEAGTHHNTKKMVHKAKEHVNTTVDPKFKCDEKTLKAFIPSVEIQLSKIREFDTAAFLRGPKGQESHVARKNQQILDQSVRFCIDLAHQIKDEKKISLQAAFKQVVGLLDHHDQHAGRGSPSTFPLRSALLLASQKENGKLESWMVFTKEGKPIQNKVWPFLDNWKNWVPEAQAVLAKFSEISIVKARKLATKYPDRKVVLLKGGFGAGKTRQAKILFAKKSVGVMAPDTGKQAVRRSMEDVTHAIAHVQGSQIAYQLFDDLIRQQTGTVAYDSSLSRPSDVRAYLQKCKEAGKKMVIYDVARHDMARVLSVLRRDVEGEDPRIPPKFIIDSAVRDKMNRVECMEVVLNDNTTPEHLRPEYHFLAADSKGWNTEEVMVLKSNQSISFTDPEEGESSLARLALEGIEYDSNEKTFSLNITEDKVRESFNIQFEQPVKELVDQLSVEEQKECVEVFTKRNFSLHSRVAVTTPAQLYEALTPEVQKAISKFAFVQAFGEVSSDTRDKFLESIQNKNAFSYMDLPLKTALVIHQNLETDPW